MNGAERLIAAVLERGEAWDVAGPEGQAIQRDDEGRTVVPLLCSRDDARALVREVYEDDEPRRHDVADTIDLLERLADEGAWIDADTRWVDGEWRSFRLPAQELLDDLLEALGRAGKDPTAQPQPDDVRRVMGLSADERYDWFLQWVAVDEAAWALGDESAFMTFPYDGGDSALVLFPHAAFAQRWASEHGSDHETYRLPWERLLSELARADEHGEQVAVFPGDDERSTVVPPVQLRGDLEDARRAQDEGEAPR